MENIEIISKIDKSGLSGIHYLESLMEQASYKEMLSQSEIEKFKLECISLLSRQTERYNNGESSSIRVEVAQSILTSIFYTIGINLKRYKNPDDAVIALQKENVETLFTKGLKVIDRKISIAKMIHAKIVNNLMITQNVFYCSTVCDGINGFFKLYRPEYAAQEIHITADYPTHITVCDLAGIEFIERYLENIYYENQFCCYFGEDRVHRLLCGFHRNYQNLLINLYQPVLATAIGSVLCEKDIQLLELSEIDVDRLYQLFEDKEAYEIIKILKQAILILKDKLSTSDELFSYLNKSIFEIAVIIKNAITLKTLSNVFIQPFNSEDEQIIMFSYGEKMEDEKFRAVIDEILQSETIENKISIIQQNIKSLADLEDVLLDSEFTNAEIDAILRLLSPTEFIALLKRYPNHIDLDLRDNEKQLCLCIAKFKDSLPCEQQLALEKAVNMLQDEL